MSSSKAKGNNFERDIARKLSLWINKEDKNIFWRTDSSGGRFTALNKRNSAESLPLQGGDIVHRKEEGFPLIKNFHIELKTGYQRIRREKNGEGKRTSYWDLLDILDGKSSVPIFIKFWEQTIRGAAITKRFPILIFRRLNRETVICFPFDFFKEFVELFGEVLFIKYNQFQIILVNFLEFLKKISPGEFIKHASSKAHYLHSEHK